MKPFGSGSSRLETKAPAPVYFRPATGADHAEIEQLAKAATSDLLGPFLSAKQRKVTSAFTPLDPWLIQDGTYYVAEIGGVIRASGGWSRRTPMIHGPGNTRTCASGEETQTTARIRAMYTDPSCARTGLGRAMLTVCETSARIAGVSRLELIATPVGELLYSACGYEVLERVELDALDGVVIEVARMQKLFDRGTEQRQAQHQYARHHDCSP